MKLLIWLPRRDLQECILVALSSAQFVMETATSAKECLQFSRFTRYEGVLVESESVLFGDLIALIRRLRQENSGAALFVFVRHLDLEQRLRLFEAGVDDCIYEPFLVPELALRLSLSIRLRQAASNLVASNSVNVLRSGDLELNLVRRTVVRTMILEHVWNSSFEGLSNVVDVYISALRSKVDRDFPQKLIQTNRGIGYTFTCVSGFPPTR